MGAKICGAICAGAILVLGAGSATKPEQRAPLVAQPPDTAIKIGEKFSLESKILNERRNYWVYLPESYQNKTFAPKRYPVLYLLDGGVNFQWTSGVLQFMSSGGNGNFQMPEVIVVAILNTQRTRDLTPSRSIKTTRGKEEPNLASSGGADKFLDFIRDELIPEVEGKFRTAPYRVLVGHSFGGLFAMNALFQRPQVFQAYISIDPSLWWNDQLLLRRAKSMLEKTNDFRGSVYVTLANNYPSTEDWDADLAAKAVRDLVELLKTNSSDQFRIDFKHYEAENHVSVPLLSLYHGLLFVFDGYKPTPAVTEDPVLAEGHFARMSGRMGYKVLPPEEFVSTYGEGALYWYHATNKAIQWFNLNIKNYPDSFINYDSLGYVYAQSGNRELAIKNYQKALELNPGHRRAAEQIRRLKGFSDSGPFTNGVYRLINKKSRKALEVIGASETNSASIVQASYAGRLHQQWSFTPQGEGYYQITAAHSRKGSRLLPTTLLLSEPDSCSGRSMAGQIRFGVWWRMGMERIAC